MVGNNWHSTSSKYRPAAGICYFSGGRCVGRGGGAFGPLSEGKVVAARCHLRWTDRQRPVYDGSGLDFKEEVSGVSTASEGGRILRSLEEMPDELFAADGSGACHPAVPEGLDGFGVAEQTMERLRHDHLGGS